MRTITRRRCLRRSASTKVNMTICKATVLHVRWNCTITLRPHRHPWTTATHCQPHHHRRRRQLCSRPTALPMAMEIRMATPEVSMVSVAAMRPRQVPRLSIYRHRVSHRCAAVPVAMHLPVSRMDPITMASDTIEVHSRHRAHTIRVHRCWVRKDNRLISASDEQSEFIFWFIHSFEIKHMNSGTTVRRLRARVVCVQFPFKFHGFQFIELFKQNLSAIFCSKSCKSDHKCHA